VETAQAGDRCDFVGTLIVVPDVGSISMPGERLMFSLFIEWTLRVHVAAEPLGVAC